MTESDYILATERARLRSALEILRTITPGNAKAVCPKFSLEAFAAALSLLFELQETLGIEITRRMR